MAETDKILQWMKKSRKKQVQISNFVVAVIVVVVVWHIVMVRTWDSQLRRCSFNSKPFYSHATTQVVHAFASRDQAV